MSARGDGGDVVSWVDVSARAAQSRRWRRILPWLLVMLMLGVAVRASARPIDGATAQEQLGNCCRLHLVAERPASPPALGMASREGGAREELVAPAVTAVTAPAPIAAPVGSVLLPRALVAGPEPPRIPIYLRLLILVL